MSKIVKKCFDKSCKNNGGHTKYLSRITKTLYYGKFPKTESLSLPVTELAAELFSEAQKGKSLERLHCYDAAKISRNACVSPCSLVLAMLYLERLKNRNPEYLNKTAPSDLFLVSLMVSCKYLFDDGESDEVFVDEWATSGGISVKDLVHLERDFLKAIDWEIYVSELTFWKKLGEIETTLAVKQGISRGHFTYSELQNLIGTIEVYNLVNCVIAVSVILAATYTIGLMTMVGSVFVASQIPGTSLYMKKMDVDRNTFLPVSNKTENVINTDMADLIKTDFNSKCTRNLDIVNVFKTTILLAAMVPTNDTNHTENLLDNEDNAQYISWDYWNVPIMDWLAQTSQFVTNYTLEMPSAYCPYFLETSASTSRCMELEDQIHKATKTRIQDQMESSWHMEWTDTIRYGLLSLDRIFPFFAVKS